MEVQNNESGNTFIFAALVVVCALVASGCTDSAPSGPSASLGSVTVTKVHCHRK